MSWKLIILMVKRGFLPATDSGGKNWWRNLPHLLVFHYMPGLGIILFFCFVAFAHLWLYSQKAELQEKLTVAKSSPFMAIFGEMSGGRVFITKRQKTDVTSSGTDSDERTWESLTVNDIMEWESYPGELGDLKIFRSIFPLATVYLALTNKQKQHRWLSGLALPFTEGDLENKGDVNEPLLEEVKKGAALWPFEEYSAVQGLILDENALNDLGFNHREPPGHVGLRTSVSEEDISLPVTVVQKLPYYSYVIPMKEKYFIDKRFYYDTPEEVKILLYKGYDQQEKDALARVIPHVGDDFLAELVGDTPAFRVTLPPGTSKAALMAALTPHAERWQLFQDMDFLAEEAGYNGAMFYLNPAIITPELLNAGILEKLRHRMERRGAFELRGDMIQTLNTAWDGLNQVQRNMHFYDNIAILFILIITILVALSLHMRLHRIGVLRMMGADAFSFVIAFCLEGFIYILLALTISCTVFCLLFGGTVNAEFLEQLSRILGRMSMFYLIGLVFPCLYYLNLSPSEMTDYRNS